MVETPNDGVTDGFDVCSPVMLCLDKVNRPVMGDKDNVSVREHKVDHTNNTALSQTQNTPTCVQRTPLTYIHVMIGNAGPYRCMSDSATELPIAKESVVCNISPPVQKQGQIKLQGIFGEPVLTDLVNLPIRASFSFLTDRLTGELTGRSTVDAFLELLTNGQMPVNASENNCSVNDNHRLPN